MDKKEEELLGRIVDNLKAKDIDHDCIIWTALSAADGGKLEEFVKFIENNHVTDEILYKWDEMNIPRQRNLYEYEEGVEYEFLMETEEEVD